MITEEELKKYVDEYVNVWALDGTTSVVELLLEYEKDRKDLVNNSVLDDVINTLPLSVDCDIYSSDECDCGKYCEG